MAKIVIELPWYLTCSKCKSKIPLKITIDISDGFNLMDFVGKILDLTKEKKK